MCIWRVFCRKSVEKKLEKSFEAQKSKAEKGGKKTFPTKKERKNWTGKKESKGKVL